MYDLIIRNATVVDGTGNPRYYADVAVKDKKIARISKALKGTATTEIDGTGRVLTPGFIDEHCHQDFCMEKNFACNHSLEQGIATLVGGMYGDSPMPWRLVVTDCPLG